ncbi:hypothetical protein BU17DRAFT_66009 [Hysterangium stoloniferum]|nr:hypothetical protein BU17DRAFT_66009 [Hysterangium stoloniferum]
MASASKCIQHMDGYNCRTRGDNTKRLYAFLHWPKSYSFISVASTFIIQIAQNVSAFDRQDTLLIGGLAYFMETIYHCIVPSYLILLTKTIVARIASNDDYRVKQFQSANNHFLFLMQLCGVRDESWIDDTFEFVGPVFCD